MLNLPYKMGIVQIKDTFGCKSGTFGFNTDKLIKFYQNFIDMQGNFAKINNTLNSGQIRVKWSIVYMPYLDFFFISIHD